MLQCINWASGKACMISLHDKQGWMGECAMADKAKKINNQDDNYGNGTSGHNANGAFLHDVVIVRYSEIGLKGKNRNIFEKRLVKNISSCLRKNKVEYSSVERIRGRIYINTKSDCSCLSRVFGISSFSASFSALPEMRDISKKAELAVRGLKKGLTFRVSCQRADKSLSFTSSDVENSLGSLVSELTRAKVSLKGYDFELGVELYQGRAFVFTSRNAGHGGLPLGISGRVLVFLEGLNSVASAWLMMKRGCAVALAGPAESRHLAECLDKWSYGAELEYFECGLYDALETAGKKGLGAFVSGQTVGSLALLEAGIMVLRPLVGYSGDDIARLLSRIRQGTCHA